MGIVDIESVVSGLPEDVEEVFNRIYSYSVKKGRVKVPEKMKDWVGKAIGSVEQAEAQKIVRVNNKWTHESSLFNELRADRPIDAKHEESLDQEINSKKDGPFCTPKDLTPEDTFGRVKVDHEITASNVFKYDKWHGLIIFNEHNPLKFGEEETVSHLNAARKWFEKAHKEDEEAKYPFLIWHCLWKSAASIVHGHMQTLVSSEQYAYPELLNKASQEYSSSYGTNYFDDLYWVHEAMGLGLHNDDVRVMAHLTPKKEKEITIIAHKFDEKFARALYKSVACLRDDFGVDSFTVGAMMPPLEHEPGWENFPVFARVIDRGSLMQKTADIGAMELFGNTSVIASDPWKVFEKLSGKF